MTKPRRWEHCVYHHSKDAEQFVAEYFAVDDRRVLLIGGAGFDPRSTVISQSLAEIMGDRLRGVFVREERPNPAEVIVERARANEEAITTQVTNCDVVPIDIFAADNAVIGGRAAIEVMRRLELAGITDVVVDVSALSVGVSFPIVKYLFDLLGSRDQKANLHVMVVDEPELDEAIVATASDTAATIHGFKGPLGLDSASHSAKLWLPLLIGKQRNVLERIHAYVEPDDVCPILPFPSSNPRVVDELIEYYAEELESAWEVDPRNLVYADQHSPLDLYRTTLRIDGARSRIFAEVGGALTILTPIGSKVLAIGSLMAAIERDFPVVYIEAVAYEVDVAKLDVQRESPGEIVHVWLSGDAYGVFTDTEGAV